MHSRFLLRFAAVLAAAVLAASPAFAQITPDTPVSPASGPGSASVALPPAVTALVTSALDATEQALAAFSSRSLEAVANRHATVQDALAAAHASPAVVDCVTRFHSAENAALTDKIRQETAKVTAELRKQRTAALAAVMKMAQDQRTDPGTSQGQLNDVGAAFDQMQANVQTQQAKLIASLR